MLNGIKLSTLRQPEDHLDRQRKAGESGQPSPHSCPLSRKMAHTVCASKRLGVNCEEKFQVLVDGSWSSALFANLLEEFVNQSHQLVHLHVLFPVVRDLQIHVHTHVA